MRCSSARMLSVASIAAFGLLSPLSVSTQAASAAYAERQASAAAKHQTVKDETAKQRAAKRRAAKHRSAKRVKGKAGKHGKARRSAAAYTALTPYSGPRGTMVTVKGSNFARYKDGWIKFRGVKVADMRTDGYGRFSKIITVPSSAPLGSATVLAAAGAYPSQDAATFNVTSTTVTSTATPVPTATPAPTATPTPVPTATSTPTATPAPVATAISLSPASGPVGTRLTVRGTDFAPDYSGWVKFNGVRIADVRSDAAGSFTTAFTVPPVPAGSATVLASVGYKVDDAVFTVTSDTTATSDPKIAAAGDIACDPAASAFNGGSGTASACRQKATSDLLLGGGYSRVIPLGDSQYEGGSLSSFRQSYDPSWGRLKSITTPAIGNHEYYTSDARGYFDYFNGAETYDGPAGPRGKGYYSYNLGKWHVVALNSNCSRVSCAAGSTQERWLRADLAANPAACTLAYMHHPRFSSGNHGNSESVAPLYKALYDGNADVLLTGHDHSYERFAPQDPSGGLDTSRGIRQFVVGVGGKGHYGFGSVKPNSQVRMQGTFGILEVNLRSTSYDWRFQAEAGKTFTDTGSTACH